jgi:hypothetical protein
MRLPASLRRSFYAAAALVAVSGVAWLALHYLGRPADAAATWALEIHGGAAMLLLFFAGALFWLHAPGAWSERKNRLSGGFVGGALAVLTLTAYLLYYAGGEAVRSDASVVHWVLGIAALPLVCLHVVLGRRTR